MQKFWSYNSTLDQERHVYACVEGFVTKFFMPKSFQGRFFHWDKVSCKTIKGFWSYLKKTSRAKVYSLPKKILEGLTRLWMHVVHLEFSSTLNSCSCTHGCFVSLILYLIYSILPELIISYLTGNKNLEINFPEITLNNTLMATDACKSTSIL